MMKEQWMMDATCGNACSCSTSASAPVGLGRRDFVTYAGAALAALALSACGMSDTMLSPTTVSATPIKLSDFPALATVGGVATTTVGGIPMAIVRSAASTFSAFSRICPHQGSTINTVGSGFVCPNHGATFNTSGQWTGGQRTSNLTAYPTQYDASTGTITIGS
jgi:nitrite reductase/ring-hydroxylating ferredoxin subunit